MAHIVDLLFPQSARYAVRKETRQRRVRKIAMFRYVWGGILVFWKRNRYGGVEIATFRYVWEESWGRGWEEGGNGVGGREEDGSWRREKGGRGRKETGKGRPYTDTAIGSCPPQGNSR